MGRNGLTGCRPAPLLLGLTLAAVACEDPDLAVPTADDVASYYQIPARTTFEMNGNVAEIGVWQPGEHIRRGGSLWVKVGPYVYLFSEATRDLLTDYPGLAAVSVTTYSPTDRWLGRATLRRDALNAVTWKRALNVAGHARKSGSRKLGLLDDLVEWGEDHTDFEYNSAYLNR